MSSMPPLKGMSRAPAKKARHGMAGISRYRWEIMLLGILVIELVLFRVYLPLLMNPSVMLGITINFMETGLIMLPMVLVIISKNIDISVGSMLALVSIVIATSFQAGLPMGAAIVLALAMGALAGFFNGLLTAKMKIPSLVVTLGTYSLYRGIAYVVLGDQTFHDYPESFLSIGRGTVLSIVPIPLVVFVVFAILFALLLHKTTFGRKVYATGNNQKATLYSGVRVDWIIVGLFTMTGVMTAVASVILTSRNASTRGNMALGMELDVITAVVLGGTSIGGGKGTILGAVISILMIGLLRNGMYAKNISPEIMKIVIGGLLIVSLLVPRFLGGLGKSEKQ
jgi:rhamnose transport system permease protein